MSRSPLHCSGDMYEAVPTVQLAEVRAVTSRSLAMPKSVSLSVPSAQDHEVGRLEVAVDDAGVVGVLQAVAELATQIDDVLPAHPAAAGHDMVERFAFDVLHGVVARALELAARVEPDDVGVVELFEDVGLALEARDGAGVVVAESGGHDLDGDDQDGLVGLDVAGAVDGAHGAGAQLLVDLERPELLSDQHKHPRPASVCRGGTVLS